MARAAANAAVRRASRAMRYGGPAQSRLAVA